MAFSSLLHQTLHFRLYSSSTPDICLTLISLFDCRPLKCLLCFRIRRPWLSGIALGMNECWWMTLLLMNSFSCACCSVTTRNTWTCRRQLPWNLVVPFGELRPCGRALQSLKHCTGLSQYVIYCKSERVSYKAQRWLKRRPHTLTVDSRHIITLPTHECIQST